MTSLDTVTKMLLSISTKWPAILKYIYALITSLRVILQRNALGIIGHFQLNNPYSQTLPFTKLSSNMYKKTLLYIFAKLRTNKHDSIQLYSKHKVCQGDSIITM